MGSQLDLTSTLPGLVLRLGCVALSPCHPNTSPPSPPQLLVNNAGIYSPDGRRPALGDFTQADLLPVFAANAAGPFLVTQQLLGDGLLGPPGSLVVNVSSIMGSCGDATVSASTPGAFAYRWAPGARSCGPR